MEVATGDKRMHDEENCAPNDTMEDGSAMKQARTNEAATNPLLSPTLKPASVAPKSASKLHFRLKSPAPAAAPPQSVPTPVAAPAFSDEPTPEEPAEAALAPIEAPEVEAAPEPEEAPAPVEVSAPAVAENEVPKVRYVSSSGYGRVTVGSTKAPKAAKTSAAPAVTSQTKAASTKSYQEAAAQLPSKRGRPKAESPAPPNSRSRNAAPDAETPAAAAPQPCANAMTLAGSEEGTSQVASRASELFGDSTEVKALLERKVKGPKYQYKERAEAMSALVTDLKAALDTTHNGQLTFVAEVAALEAALVEAKEELTARCAAVTGEASEQTRRAEKAEAECASLAGLRASAESAATEALGTLGVAQEELASLKEQLGVASALAAEREEGLVAAAANIARLEQSVASLQDQLKSEAATAAETLASTTTAMANEHASVVVSLQQQLSEETSKVATANKELSALQANHQAANEKLELLTTECASKTAALEACEAKAAASAREAEINAVKLEGATSQLTQKATELTMALSSLGDVQKAGAERETQLRETLMHAEAKACDALAASAALKEEVASLQSEVKATAAELITVQEARDLATSRYNESTKAEAAASAKAQEASDGWALEKELRARAEAREEEERRERTAATAQLIAQTQAQHALLMAADQKRVEEVAAAEARGSAVREELAASLQSAEAANERALIAEGEAASVRSMLDSTKGQVSELVALAHTSGEMKALEHRMQHQSSEATHKLEEAHAQIARLESELRAGEAQRRKMHNLIQELRGNVRVFARVRPFLPGDGVSVENAVPAVHAHADGSSLKIASAQSGEAHNFTFDKAFPPSVGQEQVFQEVSEFVQSALDGYQVCLFSYGQTGSGKTHTMQGSRNGQFRGIIPRAIEQVGRYQATLEAQGWEYNMQVTFVEIYNETVRDLLHEGKGKSEALELKMLKEGGMGVSGATKLNVDPNDLDTIGKILDLAARHRSVAGTDMNAESSRSHSVFTLHLQGVNKGLNSSLQGSLNLVDLAGSERVQRSGATGERMKEAQAINKSLSSLTDVFLAISNKNAHIPFRNSKLTHLLQPCLSGDGKTLMVVNLSPTEESFGESVCSLRFASTVNKCELGKPKKSFKDMGSSDGSSSSSAAGKKAAKK